jgi:hypothetical protein
MTTVTSKIYASKLYTIVKNSLYMYNKFMVMWSIVFQPVFRDMLSPDLLPYMYFFIILSGVRLSPLGTAATTGLLLTTPDEKWWWLWSNWCNEDWQRKPKYSQINCPSATLSTTNPTSPVPLSCDSVWWEILTASWNKPPQNWNNSFYLPQAMSTQW